MEVRLGDLVDIVSSYPDAVDRCSQYHFWINLYIFHYLQTVVIQLEYKAAGGVKHKSNKPYTGRIIHLNILCFVIKKM